MPGRVGGTIAVVFFEMNFVGAHILSCQLYTLLKCRRTLLHTTILIYTQILLATVSPKRCGHQDEREAKLGIDTAATQQTT